MGDEYGDSSADWAPDRAASVDYEAHRLLEVPVGAWSGWAGGPVAVQAQVYRDESRPSVGLMGRVKPGWRGIRVVGALGPLRLARAGAVRRSARFAVRSAGVLVVGDGALALAAHCCPLLGIWW